MIDNCDWCSKAGDLEGRTINETIFSRSFVSSPWFREGHCLVIPIRHIATIHELTSEESADIMAEIGRLAELLDEGFGTGVMQKYAQQGQNGIKMNHLHFHVFPRQKEEQGLFPTPYPNDFSAFYRPTEAQISSLLRKVRKL